MASPKDWLIFAQNDLKTAEAALKDGIAGNACFLSHQAAEKSLKAVILSRKLKIPKTHDLLFLLKLSGLPENREAYEFLNDFYIPTRYPDISENPVENLPSADTAKQAIEHATKIFNLVSLEISSAETNQRGNILSSSKGFAPILVLIILALVGGTIYLFNKPGFDLAYLKELIRNIPKKVTPLPEGCYYQEVQCIKAPCDPVLVCPNEKPEPTPTVGETANWKIYANFEYKLSLRYPESYSLEENIPPNNEWIQLIFNKSQENEFNIKADKEYSEAQVKYFLDYESNGEMAVNNTTWLTFYLPKGYGHGGPTTPIYGLQTEKNNILYSVSFSDVQEPSPLHRQILSTIKFND